MRKESGLELQIQPQPSGEVIESLETIEQPPSPRQLSQQLQKSLHPLSPHVLALLIPFSILGTLARLGLQALADYEGNGIFPLAYVQAVGCLIMGFSVGLKEAFSNL
jgi:CrcB protein